MTNPTQIAAESSNDILPPTPLWRRYLLLLAKLAFMAGALWLVARHLDLPVLARTLRHAQPGLLVVATALFIVSKLISSVRLNRFFQAIGLLLSEGYNLRLYWLGMYYNLFLPGGIGGDGYKVYLLGQQFPGRRKDIFRALLLDRISGMIALLVLLLLLFGDTDYPGWWRVGLRAGPLAVWRVSGGVRAHVVAGTRSAGCTGAVRLGAAGGAGASQWPRVALPINISSLVDSGGAATYGGWLGCPRAHVFIWCQVVWPRCGRGGKHQRAILRYLGSRFVGRRFYESWKKVVHKGLTLPGRVLVEFTLAYLS
jgi:hypothetical protein